MTWQKGKILNKLHHCFLKIPKHGDTGREYKHSQQPKVDGDFKRTVFNHLPTFTERLMSKDTGKNLMDTSLSVCTSTILFTHINTYLLFKFKHLKKHSFDSKYSLNCTNVHCFCISLIC